MALRSSRSNFPITSLIGATTDDEAISSLFGKLYTVLRHHHSPQKVYPTLANNVTLTGAAGAWALGAKTEIIPINTVTSPFDIHYVDVGTVSASDTYEVVLYSGAIASEVEIGRMRCFRASTQAGVAPPPIMTAMLPANTRISAACASQSGGSDTIAIAVFYHEY